MFTALVAAWDNSALSVQRAPYLFQKEKRFLASVLLAEEERSLYFTV